MSINWVWFCICFENNLHLIERKWVFPKAGYLSYNREKCCIATEMLSFSMRIQELVYIPEFWIQFKIDVERYWKKESSFLFLIKHYSSLCFIVKRLFILPTLVKCIKQIFNIDHIRIYHSWEWVTWFITFVRLWNGFLILYIVLVNEGNSWYVINEPNHE